jgi:hypothetical protein
MGRRFASFRTLGAEILTGPICELRRFRDEEVSLRRQRP